MQKPVVASTLITVIMMATVTTLTVHAANIEVNDVCFLADAIIAANTDAAFGILSDRRRREIRLRCTTDIPLREKLPEIASVIVESRTKVTRISRRSEHRSFYSAAECEYRTICTCWTGEFR